MNQYSSIFFILSIHRFHNCLISSISEEVYLVMFGSRYDNKERPSSAGYFAHKHSINHQMLDNFPLSLPAASLPILPLLFFYNLCVGVKRTLISFCWLKAAHELMLVSLERTNDSLGSSNYWQQLLFNLQQIRHYITCLTAAILFTPGLAIPSPFFLSYLEIEFCYLPSLC